MVNPVRKFVSNALKVFGCRPVVVSIERGKSTTQERPSRVPGVSPKKVGVYTFTRHYSDGSQKMVRNECYSISNLRERMAALSDKAKA